MPVMNTEPYPPDDGQPAVPDSAPLTDAQKQEIDRRLAAHRANPKAAIPWEQVEADLRTRLSTRR